MIRRDDFLGSSSAKTSIFPCNFLERQSCRDPYLSIRLSRRTHTAQLGNVSSRIYLSGSPVPSFLPREPKPLAVVTFRGEGSNGLAQDYLYLRTSASLIIAGGNTAPPRRRGHRQEVGRHSGERGSGQTTRAYVGAPTPTTTSFNLVACHVLPWSTIPMITDGHVCHLHRRSNHGGGSPSAYLACSRAQFVPHGLRWCGT